MTLSSARTTWRGLALVGLAVLSIPTALWAGATTAILYERWLWNVPWNPAPSEAGGHAELTPGRATVIEGVWQSSALVALWLGLWWLLFVRRSDAPLWANHKALTVLAAFAIFTGAVTAWAMTAYP